ncbi:LuxR C-terminal-related transcriptional regulator [Nocardia sp. NPDC058058]|uniref:helix-turn-helix transcriptional regulator n=1 Tax=Nocardia sp. NPDC058058 TaxID=3346317 RepID=UPI0036DE149C
MRFLERTQALEVLRAAWADIAAGTGSAVVLSVGGETGVFIALPDTPGPPPGARSDATFPRPVPSSPPVSRTVPGLTDRQQDVLDLLCAGLTNAEIAEYLVLSVRTVDHHVSAILRVLGVRNRRAARAKVLGDESPVQSGHPTGPRAALTHHNSHPSRRLRSA